MIRHAVINRKLIRLLIAPAIALIPALCMAESVILQANLEGTGIYNDIGPRKDSSLLWKFDAGSPIISTPIVYENSVYFIDFENSVYALNKDDGTIIWSKELEGQPSFQITANEEMLFIGLSSPEDQASSYMLALDKKTGEEHWRFETEVQIGMDSPIAHEDKLYFTLMYGQLFSLDINTGEEAWRFPISGGSGQPLISGDTLYLQDDSQTLYAIDLIDGSEKWQKTPQHSPTSEIAHPALNNCCILTISNNESSGLIIITNRHTGETEAEFSIEHPSLSSISLADKVAFFGDEGEGHADAHGYMNAMDIESGELLWRFETEGFVRGAASIAGDTVYFGSHDHYMYAVNRHTGEMRWRYETNAGIASTPAIVDGRLYFGSIDGHLYVLE
ncbi:PQQ-binding-like beta-propeller repeat protein [Halomonas sp. LY9]